MPHPPRAPIVAFALTIALASLVMVGCDEAAAPQKVDEATPRPLRPLVYTEYPELTPEAIAVRERRLMRQLIEGAEEGSWGAMEQAAPLPPRADAEALGRAIVGALISRDERLWDHVFVDPAAYAGLVHLDLREAREFVDEQQGASAEAWELFEPELASEARPGGFAEVYEFRELELGQGRDIDGRLAEEGEPVVQHWGNVLRIGYVGGDAVFEITIPKILRVGAGLAVASPIKADARLAGMLRAGLHLKPELLRSQEYPYPLAVGNFWRYRRSLGEAPSGPVDPLEAELVEEEADATEVLLEVVEVERFGSMRLVQLRRSYNDAALTKVDVWWLLTPRRIYACDTSCRRHVEDLEWILAYMDREPPLFDFPLRGGQGWRAGGRAGKEPVFRVERAEAVTVPAGVFEAVVDLVGRGPIGAADPYLRRDQVRTFSPGRGVVRRRLSARGDDEDPVIEELVEYRVMP